MPVHCLENWTDSPLSLQKTDTNLDTSTLPLTHIVQRELQTFQKQNDSKRLMKSIVRKRLTEPVSFPSFPHFHLLPSNLTFEFYYRALYRKHNSPSLFEFKMEQKKVHWQPCCVQHSIVSDQLLHRNRLHAIWNQTSCNCKLYRKKN